VLVNFDAEIDIWEKLIENIFEIQSDKISTSLAKTLSVTLTLAPFSPTKVRERVLEVIFEYFQFAALHPTSSMNVVREQVAESHAEINSKYLMLIESGHSATYICPYLLGNSVNHATLRLDVGGRLLTKKLKEMISFKYIKLNNEIKLVGDIKESLCYVSMDFRSEMSLRKHALAKIYRLPDIEVNRKGYVMVRVDDNDRKSANFLY
jgi:actin-related protein 6